jgi:hypothetical protein
MGDVGLVLERAPPPQIVVLLAGQFTPLEGIVHVTL